MRVRRLKSSGRLEKELPEATIYVYDNNSSDNTAAIAREAGAVVRYEYQQERET